MKSLGAYQKIQKREVTTAEKLELIEKYATLVKVMAFRAIGRMPPHQMVEDLISCGTIGLLEAVENFDPKMNIQFETFAKFRIRGAIIDEMRDRDWIPRSIRAKMREIDDTFRRLSIELDHPPEDLDMANAFGKSLQEYYEFIIDIQPAGMISYDEIAGVEISEKKVLDFLEDKRSPHPDLEIQIKEMKGKIISALEGLDEDERLVMALYYYEGLTFREISEVIQVTESRVSQIHSKCLIKLNRRLGDYKHDRPELGEEDVFSF